MANDLTSNPLRCDTTATIISEGSPRHVQNMQWVDDDSAAGGVIANGEDLIMVINGVTVEINVAAVATNIAGPAWEIAFAKPILIQTMSVTMVGGTLFVWTV